MNREALGLFWEKHQPRLRRYLRCVCDQAEREEIEQRVALRLLGSEKEWRGVGILISAARYEIKEFYRRRGKCKCEQLSDVHLETIPQKQELQDRSYEHRVCLCEIIKGTRRRRARRVLLAAGLGYCSREIAVSLKIKTLSVEMLLWRARKRLRETVVKTFN